MILIVFRYFKKITRYIASYVTYVKKYITAMCYCYNALLPSLQVSVPSFNLLGLLY